MKLFPISESDENIIKKEVDVLNFFDIQVFDSSHITANSTLEEIIPALELCEKELLRIHSEILPLLRGSDFHIVKLIEKDLISKYISMLILLNNKRNEK